MKFSEFNKRKVDETHQPSMIIDGSFACQSCDETVDEADYFQNERILRWKCSQDHVSFIEEFRL